MWKWTNKKMAVVSMLIATSVVFVIVGTQFAAITAIPSFKVAFGGLPVKLTGYIFGPLVGAITGILADLLSFAIIPISYHPGYTLVMAISGFVPGVVMWIMVKKTRSINTHYFTTLSVLVILLIGILFTILYLPDNFVGNGSKDSKKWTVILWTKHRWIFLVLTLSGIVLLITVLTITRFFAKPKIFIGLAPIIMFCAILEVVNNIQTPLWDKSLFGIPYAVSFIGHIVTSPFKIMANIFIIYFAWRVVFPVVNRNQSNSY